MARALGWLAHAVYHHPRLFFYPQMLLFVVCVFYGLPKPYGHLEFDPSRNNLVGEGKKYHQDYLRYQTEFSAQDDLVVVVESDDTEKNRQFVERLGRSSKRKPISSRMYFSRAISRCWEKRPCCLCRKPTYLN